tara:strand:+ start:758 stop:1150 length:393 start_codon:yes stop_codon:yes gene_type:complete
VNNINLITPPDKIYNDNTSILLLFPTQTNLAYIQKNILPSVNGGMNIYIYDKPNYTTVDVNWLLDTVYLCDLIIIEVDNCPTYIKDLLSFIIAKSKTYWLTNAVDTVYTHISSNRIYNLSILEKLGDSVE